MAKINIVGRANGVFACFSADVGDIDWVPMSMDDIGKAKKNELPTEIVEINLVTESGNRQIRVKTIEVWGVEIARPK